MSRQGKKTPPGKSDGRSFAGDRDWEKVFLKEDPDHILEREPDSFNAWMEAALEKCDFSNIAKVIPTDRGIPVKKRPGRHTSENAPVLDLHGLGRETAVSKMIQFISEEKRDMTEWIKIIVGKGHHSLGGKAILRDEAEQLLIRMKKNGQIADWFWEKKEKAKSGYVLIRIQS